MNGQETTFGHLICSLVVHNCHLRGTRYRVWHDGRLLGEYADQEAARCSARLAEASAGGQAEVEQLW
jgi:hypothetical protein